jgi:hypothetical protein
MENKMNLQESIRNDLNKIAEEGDEPKQKYNAYSSYDEKTKPTAWQDPADDLSGLKDWELEDIRDGSGNGVDYMIKDLQRLIHKVIVAMKEIDKRNLHSDSSYLQRDIKDLITAYNTIRDLDWSNQEEEGHWFTKEK